MAYGGLNIIYEDVEVYAIVAVDDDGVVDVGVVDVDAGAGDDMAAVEGETRATTASLSSSLMSSPPPLASSSSPSPSSIRRHHGGHLTAFAVAFFAVITIVVEAFQEILWC